MIQVNVIENRKRNSHF